MKWDKGLCMEETDFQIKSMGEWRMENLRDRAFAWGNSDDSAVMAVMKKAISGRPVTVAALGGSITEGFYSSAPEKAYAGIMAKWWKEKFPETEVHYINAGIGATDSYLGLHRAGRDVLSHEPDFIIVDFTVNDAAEPFYEKSYERLMQILLSAESRPAVVLLFMTMEDGTNAQAYHSKVGEKYRLPMISYGNVVLAEIEAGQYQWTDISPDDIHPNDRGHEIAGGLVCAYLDKVYDRCVSTAHRPCEKEEKAESSFLEQKSSAADILDGKGTEPEAWGGWEKADLHPHLHHGWLGSTETGSLEFELEFANLGVTYFKSIDGSFGKAEVYVDGKREAVLDGDFPDGWGDYAGSDEVYASDQRKKHHVKIRMPEDREKKKFAVLALLVS